MTKDGVIQIKKKETSAIVNRLFENAGIPNEPIVEQKWEELDELYMTCATGIVDVGNGINEAINTINTIGTLSSNELITAVNAAKKDIESFTSDLLKIRKRHEGMHGAVKDGDELALCINIFNDYLIYQDRFKAIIFPTMLTVTEHLSETVANYKKQNAETQVQEIPTEDKQ